MKLDKHCSVSGIFVHCGIPAFIELQRKYFTNYIYRLQSSSNSNILSSVPLFHLSGPAGLIVYTVANDIT